MAATNFTPIQLYFSTTASAVPLAANLAQGELAINITDGKLYYEDGSGVVQVIATKGAGTIGGSTTQIQYNNAGALAGNAAMVFNSTTSVTTLSTLNLTNALGATFGGTAQSTYIQGDILYSSATNTLAKLGIGANTFILTSTGSVPQWVAPSSIAVLTATNLAGGLAGSVPYQSALDTTTFLAIGAANRVMTSTGTAPQWVTSLTGLTGVSSSSITNTGLTATRVVFSSTAGLQADSASLTFDGTTLSAGGYSTTGLSTLVKTVKIGDSSFNGVAVFAAATPAKLYMGTGTVTDVTSAISATNTTGAIASLAITPIAATNTGVTYTNASTLYIAGAPSAGTNITITNPYALYIAAGAAYLGGAVTLDGGTANGVAYLNGSKVLTTGSALTFDGTNLGVGTASPSRFIDFEKNQNNSTVARIANTTSGTAAYSALQLTASSTTYLYNFSSGYTTSGKFAADTTLLDANGTGGLTLCATAAAPIAFYTNNAEQMRLTSTGLGIGTSSPGAKLGVLSADGATTSIVAGATGKLRTFGYADATRGALLDSINTAENTYLPLTLNGSSLLLQTGATTRATLDSAGNLGLGVTPSAWATLKPIQFSGGASLAGFAGIGYLGANCYFNSGWKYIDTAASGRYEVADNHKWFTAPSGTAGNAISFTQAMTLDASGNLGLGETSPSAIASGFTTMLIKGSNGGGIRCGTTNQFYIYSDSTNAFLNQTSNGYMAFATNNTERARIDSSGNLLVGTTSQLTGEKLGVDTTGASSKAITAKNNAGDGAATVFVWNAATSGDNLFVGFGTEANGAQRGSITYNRAGGLVMYNQTSDYRAKDINGPVTNSGALIDSVPVYMGKMHGAMQERPMFIAHEVPAYAHTGKKDAVDADGNPVYQQMDASALIPVMWAEIQDLRKRLAAAGIA